MMPWWAWAAGGFGVLLVELFLIDAGFYLVFLGASAIATGFCALAFGVSSLTVELLLFGGLSLVSMVGFRRQVYARIRRTGPDRPEGATGEWALARERIEPGAVGRVELRGAPWSARNVGAAAIEPGSRAQVVRAESLLLHIQAEPG
jgi:inner membrane protein